MLGSFYLVVGEIFMSSNCKVTFVIASTLMFYILKVVLKFKTIKC